MCNGKTIEPLGIVCKRIIKGISIKLHYRQKQKNIYLLFINNSNKALLQFVKDIRLKVEVFIRLFVVQNLYQSSECLLFMAKLSCVRGQITKSASESARKPLTECRQSVSFIPLPTAEFVSVE